MPFATGRAVVAGAKRFLFSGPKILEEILHFGRRKDEITLEHRRRRFVTARPAQRSIHGVKRSRVRALHRLWRRLFP